MNQLSNKHIAFRTASEVEDLYKPLGDFFAANFFLYQRNFLDTETMRVKSSAFLCNHADSLEFILTFPSNQRESAKYDCSAAKNQYVLFDSTQPKFSAILREKFNFNHIFCRDEKIGKDEWEHFLIGSSINSMNVINSYLNNIDFLEKFVLYFREKAIKLITTSCKDKFFLNRKIEMCNFNSLNSDNTTREKTSFIVKPKHYFLTDTYNKKISIPSSEIRVLGLLYKGRTAKDIGRILDLSHRTIESHIYNSKMRLNCHTKSMLLDVLEKNKIWLLNEE